MSNNKIDVLWRALGDVVARFQTDGGAAQWRKELESAHTKQQAEAMKSSRYTEEMSKGSPKITSPFQPLAGDEKTALLQPSAAAAKTIKMAAETAEIGGKGTHNFGAIVELTGESRREVPALTISRPVNLILQRQSSPEESSSHLSASRRSTAMTFTSLSTDQFHLLPDDEGLHLVIRNALMLPGDALRVAEAVRRQMPDKQDMSMKVTLNGQVLREYADSDADDSAERFIVDF